MSTNNGAMFLEQLVTEGKSSAVKRPELLILIELG